MLKDNRSLKIFLSSVFFVIGFSLVFSILGVLLQTVLSNVSYSVQKWLNRVAGVIIILFGLYLLELISPDFLGKVRNLKVKKFNSTYITSLLFGAAFAVGWTPCVGAVLGAVLGIAVSQPGSAFVLLLVYSLGLGVPFILVGLFFDRIQRLVKKPMPWLKHLQYFFGVIIIFIGVLVFVSQLSRVANFPLVADFLIGIGIDINFGQSVTLAVAFLAGLVSFLSPCVMPLIPGFLAYLASVGVKK